MSTPPVVDPNEQINDQMYLDALNSARRVIDIITAAASDGTYINVDRLDNRLVVRSMKGDQDLYVTKTIQLDYSSVVNSDEPREVTVPLDSPGVEFVMGNTTTVDDNYTILVTDTTVRVDASADPVTVKLPTGSTVGAVKIIKKIDSTRNAVVLDGNGAQIDGHPTVSITIQNRAIWVQWNSTGWDLLVSQSLY